MIRLPDWIIYLLLAIVALISAAALGWWLGQPEPVQETFAPAVHQDDGSVMLERKPDATAKPAHQVPKAAKVERMGRVTVQPAARSSGGMDASSVGMADPCPPVTVDWSLVREADGGRRFLASSPGGTIVGGVDVPVESAASPAEPLRWAAGLSWSPANETGGVWIERDVPLFATAARVGVDINQTRTDHGSTGSDVRIKVGMTF